MRDRNIRPPIPRRDADLLGQIVDAVDRAAFVAAGDHQRALHARERLRHHLDEKGFPFARDRSRIDLAVADQLIDQPALADRADDNRALPGAAVS